MTTAPEWIERLRLGRTAGAVPVAVVPAGAWFAARCEHHSAYALAGCTVAPGFSFEDFEMADPQTLLRDFPHDAPLIREFAPTP